MWETVSVSLDLGICGTMLTFLQGNPLNRQLANVTAGFKCAPYQISISNIGETEERTDIPEV